LRSSRSEAAEEEEEEEKESSERHGDGEELSLRQDGACRRSSGFSALSRFVFYTKSIFFYGNSPNALVSKGAMAMAIPSFAAGHR
jgi:hypothetical protein